MRTLLESLKIPFTSRDRFDATVFGFLVMFAACSSFSIALTQIGYFTALILWVGRMVYRRTFQWPKTPLDFFFLAYAGAEVLATLFSHYPLYSLLYLQRRLLLLPIVYILIANVRSDIDAKALVGAIIISAIGVALYSLIPLFVHFRDYLLWKRRLGEFQIYMTAGGLQMIAVLLMVSFLVHKRTPRKVRIVIAAFLIPALINLFFTFTRSAWLGCIAGTLIIAAYRSWRLVLAVVALILIAYLLSTPEMRYARFYAIVDPYHPHNLSRLHMWRTGWRCFLDHPVVGIGDIGTETIWDEYAEPGWGPEGHLHNNIVQVAVTLGLVGLAALVAFFIKAWLAVARVHKRLRDDWFGGSLALGTLAVMAGFHTAGLFEWNFGDAEISMLIWATLGLTLAMDRVAATAGAAS
jgi:O-antigen ligase